MRSVAIIQSRMGSTRLPGKVLKDMGGRPMLHRLLDNVKTSQLLDRVVVACSNSPADTAIEALCNQTGTIVHRGSEHDVLERLWSAACSEQADIVVRLTGDNPLVTGDLVDIVLRQMRATDTNYDYAHTVDGTGWPYGLAVEAITIQALTTARQSSDPADREHVTRYVRQRPKMFRHLAVPCPHNLQDVSVTVDTHDELAAVSELVAQLETSGRPLTYNRILELLTKRSGAAQ